MDDKLGGACRSVCLAVSAQYVGGIWAYIKISSSRNTAILVSLRQGHTLRGISSARLASRDLCVSDTKLNPPVSQTTKFALHLGRINTAGGYLTWLSTPERSLFRDMCRDSSAIAAVTIAARSPPLPPLPPPPSNCHLRAPQRTSRREAWFSGFRFRTSAFRSCDAQKSNASYKYNMRCR